MGALLGPRERPLCATALAPVSEYYAYRICRKGEHPWDLRRPVDCAGLSFMETRALVVTAVATGNDPARPSCFLHATRKLRKALLIFGERGHLYSHFLVRWPKQLVGVTMADFERLGERQKWFFEHDEDSAYLAECVRLCRNYTEKDSEIVYFDRPAQHLVEWWDEDGKTWRGSADNSAQSQFWRKKLTRQSEEPPASSSGVPSLGQDVPI